MWSSFVSNILHSWISNTNLATFQRHNFGVLSAANYWVVPSDGLNALFAEESLAIPAQINILDATKIYMYFGHLKPVVHSQKESRNGKIMSEIYWTYSCSFRTKIIVIVISKYLLRRVREVHPWFEGLAIVSWFLKSPEARTRRVTHSYENVRYVEFLKIK